MPNLAKITQVFSINPCMGFFSGFFEYKVHMSSISWNKSLLNLIKTCYWPQGQLKSEQHYILYWSKSAFSSALLILVFFYVNRPFASLFSSTFSVKGPSGVVPSIVQSVFNSLPGSSLSMWWWKSIESPRLIQERHFRYKTRHSLRRLKVFLAVGQWVGLRDLAHIFLTHVFMDDSVFIQCFI